MLLFATSQFIANYALSRISQYRMWHVYWAILTESRNLPVTYCSSGTLASKVGGRSCKTFRNFVVRNCKNITWLSHYFTKYSRISDLQYNGVYLLKLTSDAAGPDITSSMTNPAVDGLWKYFSGFMYCAWVTWCTCKLFTTRNIHGYSLTTCWRTTFCAIWLHLSNTINVSVSVTDLNSTARQHVMLVHHTRSFEDRPTKNLRLQVNYDRKRLNLKL